MAAQNPTGVPTILADDNTGLMVFQMPTFAVSPLGISFGQEPASWFETIKDAFRNNRNIQVLFDDTVTKYSFQGNLIPIPTDIHNVP